MDRPAQIHCYRGNVMKSAIAAIILVFMTTCTNIMAIRGPGPNIVSKVRKPVLSCADHRPMVAIVIDDIGRRAHDQEPFLALPIPVTFSVFPNLPLSRQAIEKATVAGYEVWGHIPMEPIMASVMEPDLKFLLVSDTPAGIREKLVNMLESLPDIKGINNHMGSRFTQDPGLMSVVIKVLKRRGLYFLDSRTTYLTMARATAQSMHLPALRRDVFLDDIRDPTAVGASLDKLVQKALQKGCALAIGHPFPETALGISRWLKTSVRSKVRFVFASDLFSCPRFEDAVQCTPGE